MAQLTINYTATQDLSSFSTWLTDNVASSTYDSTTQEGTLTLNDGVTEIGQGAFAGCTALTSMILPDGIITLSKWPFQNCSSLTSITLPSTVTSLGEACFQSCSSLTSITLPSALITLGVASFRWCSHLSSVNFLNSPLVIPNMCFEGCSALTSITLPSSVTTLGEICFKDCTGFTSVTIPSSVTTLQSNCFKGCRNLLSIDISSVTSLGNGCFYECLNLTNVILSQNITSLPDSIFYKCNLSSIVIPNPVTSIGRSAFSNNTSLTSIVIPSLVTSISQYAFSSCTNLLSVTCKATTPPTLASDNFTASGDTLYVPSASVSAYQNDASWSAAFTTIEAMPLEIHYTATADLKAFSTWLTNNVNQSASTWDSTTNEGTLVLNDGIAWFASGTFRNCTDLLTITLPVGFLYLYGPNISSDVNGVFAGCTNLTTVNILDTNIQISNATFYNCPSLTTINFSDLNQKNVSDYTFYGCNSLLQSNFNWANITSIGRYAFYGCRSFTNLELKTTNASSFAYCTGLTSVKITGLLIASNCFQGCTSLSSVAISNTTNQIDSYAFSGCTSLTSIDLQNIKRLDSNVFSGCTNLSTIKTLRKIPPQNTTSSTFPANNLTLYVPFTGLSNYQGSTFASYFTQIIPFNVIEYTATTDLKDFSSWCTINVDQTSSLWNSSTNKGTLVLNPNVTSISTGAFANCTTLTSILLYNLDIDTSAFTGCTSLIAVQCIDSSPRTLGTGNFTGATPNLYVISDYMSAFQNDSSWSSAFNTINAFFKITFTASNTINTVLYDYTVYYEYDSVSHEGAFHLCYDFTTLPQSAFYGVTSLTSITIPNDITSISIGCFQMCSNLVHVNLPEELTFISEQAFSQCSNLTSITIPENVTTIQQGAFMNCSKLTTVNWNAIHARPGSSMYYRVFANCSALTNFNIGNSVEYIPQGLFNSSNTSFTNLVIPSSVTSIDSYAFNNLTNLLSVTSLATTPPTLGGNNFSASGDTLYTPMASKSAYQSANNWSTAFTNYVGLCEVTSTVTGTGSVSPSSATLNEGESVTLTITPAEGYGIFSVTDNVTEVPVTRTGMTYTISNIAADHAIAVVFKPLFTITTSAGEGGSITPSMTVMQNEDATIVITPNAGYSVSHVYVDGVDQGSILNYTFQNVVANHTVTTEFVALYTVSTTTTEGGTITPESSTVVAGSDVTLTITPDEGMLIFNVLDNDTPVPVLNPLGMTYTISNIQENHTVEVIFMVAQTWGFNLEEMIDTDFMIQTLEELEERK